MALRSILACCLVLLLTACASRPPSDWPAGAQPLEYFERSYSADAQNQAFQSQADYLGWVSRFYEGVSPVPGWLEMSRQVLADMEEPARSEVERRLFALGGVIGAEWAKDNNVRRLDSRMANVWRDALIEARAQDDIPGFLTRLESDIDALLAGELSGDDIYFERYYIDEFDF